MPIDFPNSPTTNQTFSSGGVTWRYDGTKWGVDAVSGPSYVTSLPASPVDGQEVYYQASGHMATNGVAWHLRYRSANATWEFLGGPDFLIGPSGDRYIATAHTTIAQLTNGPSLTIPRNGDYLVFYSARAQLWSTTGSNIEITLRYTRSGTTTSLYTNTSYHSTQYQRFDMPTRLATTLQSGDELTIWGRNPNAVDYSFLQGVIAVQPVRLWS